MGHLCCFCFFFFARPQHLRIAYLFVLCWFPLHCNCSLSSCSWSNHITELSAFFFPLYFFPVRSHAPMARSSLTPFDISLLPHFNINCLPEEKQVWGAGAEHLHVSVCEQQLLPSVPHSHRSFLWAACNSPTLLAPAWLQEGQVCECAALSAWAGVQWQGSELCLLPLSPCNRPAEGFLPLHRAIIMTQLQFKDAFWVSEHLLCVSYIQCLCILKSFKIQLGSIYSLKLI